MTVREIARLLGAEVEEGGAAELEIRRVAKIEEAEAGDIAFLANPKYARHLGATAASAVIVGRGVRHAPDAARRPVLLRVDDPYVGFLKVLVTLNPPRDPIPPGVHAAAVVHPTAALGAGVRVGAGAVVGERCRVGERTVVGHGVVLADDVQVGPDCLLYHNVTVREGCRLGARVIVQPGAVIGSDGFGFAPRPDGSFEKIPQVGIVVVEDDVEIGANCTIDRATMGETRIRRGAKLDNLIQIAHNVVVGENTVMAAQAGVSGSTRIGANCMVGGQVGFTGHIEIADRTRVGAQSGVHHSVTQPGTAILGYPALPHREALKVMTSLSKLPELVEAVRQLREAVARLEGGEAGGTRTGGAPAAS